MDQTNMFRHLFLMAPDTPAPGVAPAPTSTPAPAPTPGPTPSPAPAPDATEKKYTDAELNDIIKGKQSEQVNKLLKDLGIESQGSLKERIAALKKYEDEHKTELDKEKEGRSAAEKARDEAVTRADKAEAKAEALALGVPADRADDLVSLAMSEQGETIKDKVTNALTKRPWMKEPTTPPAPNANGRIHNQTLTSAEQAQSTFNQALGLRPAEATK